MYVPILAEVNKLVTLESERLIMRNYKSSDLAQYHKLMSDKKNMYYTIPFDIPTNTVEESLESMNNAIEFNTGNKGFRFCLALKENNIMIGAIGYEVPHETPVGRVADPIG